MLPPRVRTAYILDAVRTPIGKYGSGLRSVRPDDLAAYTLRALVERSPGSEELLDHVVLGATNQAGEDNRNVARMALLLAGLSYEVAGVTVNRLCGSGLEAIADAARMIATGEAECVIAGGVESMTRAPFVMAKRSEKWERYPPIVYDTTIGWRFPNPRLAERFELQSNGDAVENVVVKYGIAREQQDLYALESHRRAARAWEDGAFDAEVVPVTVAKRGRPVVVFKRDECVRPDASIESLGKLPAVFRKGGTLTAGNSSPINDGAAALMVVSEDVLKTLNREPLARIVASQATGIDPRLLALGPVPTVRKLLRRVGRRLSDIDLIEVNEAFAAQVLACARGLDLDMSKLNVNGGSIALGHPLACSGARIVCTLLHAMAARNVKKGMAALCVGVGQGMAMLFDR